MKNFSYKRHCDWILVSMEGDEVITIEGLDIIARKLIENSILPEVGDTVDIDCNFPIGICSVSRVDLTIDKRKVGIRIRLCIGDGRSMSVGNKIKTR